MTSLADFKINIEINNPVPAPSAKKFYVIQNAEWVETITIAKKCRETHPEEPIEIYPLDTGLFTVVREVVS